jgi:hypothetical protein
MRKDHVRYGGLVVLLLLLIGVAAQVQAAPTAAPTQQSVAPTYRIFATRQGLVGYTTANGHKIVPRDRFVALPSWAVLSPRGTDKYKVRLTYKGRSVVVPVWDVGPWNTNDDYWNTNRRYSDLPVGRPMAHAAYYDGYNGGLDMFGRKINNPNGIDIADGTFWDDLGMTRNDYVEVSFLWLGQDPGPGAAAPVAPPPSVTETGPPPKPVEVEAGATALDNSDAGFTASGGPWFELGCGMNGKHAWTYSTSDVSKSTNLGIWQPELPTAGFYELKAYIPECGAAATRSATYRVYHDGSTTEVQVDQQATAGTWTSLGVFYFGGEGNEQPKVELSDLTRDNGLTVRFDALAWSPRQDTAAPDATITAIIREGTGYRIRWGGADDMSGIATYDVQVRQLPRGGWADWKTAVSETEAWWGPDEGRHFAFRVRGRDWAGNQEPWPEEADMDTTQATQP